MTLKKELCEAPLLAGEDSWNESEEREANITLDENENLYKISNLDAYWNTCSSVQGMAIMSMPIVVLFSGYWFVVATIGIAWLSSYTSKILVKCLYEVFPGRGNLRVRETYADIGEAVWPSYGRRLVLITKFLELIFIATINPVVCGETLYASCRSLPISKRVWILIFGLAMVPNVFLNSIKFLSRISMLTIIVSLATFAVIFCYSLSQVQTWNIQDLLVFDGEKFPLGIGVISTSYSSQIYLAVIESKMKNPQDFGKVVNYGYITMTLVKLGVGLSGYLTFSKNTVEVITNNLPGRLRDGLNVLVIVLSFLGYSLPMFAVFDMMENSAFWFIGQRFEEEVEQRRLNRPCFFFIRLMLTGITILIAVLVPHFTLMVAFIGNFTAACIIFVFPCVFYVVLKFTEIRWYEIFLNVFIILFGITTMIIGLYFTGRDLIETYTREDFYY